MVLAHPVDPSLGRVVVVRACVALDNLDQVSALGIGQGYCFGRATKMQRIKPFECGTLLLLSNVEEKFEPHNKVHIDFPIFAIRITPFVQPQRKGVASWAVCTGSSQR